MRTPEEFDDIRPYDPEELPEVFEELIADAEFRSAVQWVMPDTPFEKAAALLRTCQTNLDVQKAFFYPLLHNLLSKCSNGFKVKGSEAIDKTAPHTFISNHRDIVLDSAFLSVGLLDNGFGNTLEIAIGDNLLIRPWIKKLVRVNKSFIVERSASMRQMLLSSARMSRYMHYAVSVKKENIWIAQREGRAKNSDDRTQDAILKMMVMGGEGTIVERLKNLNIVPIALSYEYDPCDYLKAKEFQQKRDIEGFRKSPTDDLVNMQTGIFGYKGRICFHMAESLNGWLDTLPADMPKTELFPCIAARIDREIHRHYTLYPGNYVAADLLSGTDDLSAHYTAEEKMNFEAYLQSRIEKVDLPNPDTAFLRERLLEMYANPVFNHLAACND